MSTCTVRALFKESKIVPDRSDSKKQVKFPGKNSKKNTAKIIGFTGCFPAGALKKNSLQGISITGTVKVEWNFTYLQK